MCLENRNSTCVTYVCTYTMRACVCACSTDAAKENMEFPLKNIYL